MNENQARLAIDAGKSHAHGIMLRILLAYCAGSEKNPMAWLSHIRTQAETEMKSTVTTGLSDEASVLAVQAGLGILATLFDGFEP